MGQQIKFARDDYVKSITRIYDKNGKVIGTGFLVAFGYVITCSHVVLQAIGIKSKEFDAYEGVPSNLIELDFPILANGKKIKAMVKSWLPYNISEGDVAGLQLLQDQPNEAKPIPLVHFSFSEIKYDEHSVYGFGNANGEQSDAYKPKTITAGGRFQFHKAGNPNDETIEGGFSGAPVWNEQKNCVVGMIATAQVSEEESRSKAYAIPKKAIDSTLKRLLVFSLSDLIEKDLKKLPIDQKRKLRNAISNAFRYCNSGSVWNENNGENELQNRLSSLSELGDRGWDGVDRLTQWAIFLATMGDLIADETFLKCEKWVSSRGFNFPNLLGIAVTEKRKRIVSSTFVPENLVIEVRPNEQKEGNVYISMWAIGERNTYDPKHPPQALLVDKTLPFAELPNFIDNWIDEDECLQEPMVHFFVPRSWLGKNLDSCKTQSGLTLGSQYKLVMRIDFNQSPTKAKYYNLWQEKWNKLFQENGQTNALALFAQVDSTKKVQLLQLKSAKMAILNNLAEAKVDGVFAFIAKKTALPVALWVRSSEFSERVEEILDCTVLELPERILQERLEALENSENNSLGHHLSLVWEDPKIFPPTMNVYFSQEVPHKNESTA